jgi:DNA polymerase-1
VPGSTDIRLHWVQTLDDAFALKRWLGERRPGGWLGVDTESGGLDWWRDKLRLVQFGDRHQGWAIESSEWMGLIKECMTAYEGPQLLWNVKHDLHFMEVNGIPTKRWWMHDGRAMTHLQEPWRRTGLKPTATRKLGQWAGYGEAQLKQAMMAGGYGYHDIPIELFWQYSAFDTVITAQTGEEVWPGIEQSYRSIYDLELASTFVLTDMERRGIMTDRDWMVRHLDEWTQAQDVIALRLRNDYWIGNPASDRQVEKSLRDLAGWVPIVFTDKGNISLEREVLQGIGHPIADLVVEWRQLKRLREYASSHLELAGPDGRLHCKINPLGTRTGRESASSPNLQNLPRDDNRIRNGFIASPGTKLLFADYDQIEGRLFASFSGDVNMLASIRYGDEMTGRGYSGYDMHSMAARMIFGIGVDQPVPKTHRNKAKTGQFSKIYGVGLDKFAARNGMTLDEARAFFAVYEGQFPETRKSGFQSRITKELIDREWAEGEAYVLTAYGRKEPCYPSQAYKALNYKIQGTAADVLKDRKVALSKTWLGECMLLSIHDEVIFEIPEDSVAEAVRTVRETMPERDKFQVPLTVGIAIGDRWGEKTDVPASYAA